MGKNTIDTFSNIGDKTGKLFGKNNIFSHDFPINHGETIWKNYLL